MNERRRTGGRASRGDRESAPSLRRSPPLKLLARVFSQCARPMSSRISFTRPRRCFADTCAHPLGTCSEYILTRHWRILIRKRDRCRPTEHRLRAQYSRVSGGKRRKRSERRGDAHGGGQLQGGAVVERLGHSELLEQYFALHDVHRVVPERAQLARPPVHENRAGHVLLPAAPASPEASLHSIRHQQQSTCNKSTAPSSVARDGDGDGDATANRKQARARAHL